jgi:hypothetical protein
MCLRLVGYGSGAVDGGMLVAVTRVSGCGRLSPRRVKNTGCGRGLGSRTIV